MKNKTKKRIRKTLELLESKTIDEEAGIYEAYISTEVVDRDGDIVVAAGADVSNYEKNPVVLFGHRYNDPQAVVGKALEIVKEEGKGIRAKWQFAPLGTSVGADAVRRLWANGFLNATSIGFMVPDGGTEDIVAEGDEGETRRTGIRFNEWELLEFSIVPVPANQDALRLAIKEIRKDLEDLADGEAIPVSDEHLEDSVVDLSLSIDDIIKAIAGKEEDPGDPTDEDLELEEEELVIETDEEEAEDDSDPVIDEDNELTEEEEAALEEAVDYLEEVLDELGLSIASTED